MTSACCGRLPSVDATTPAVLHLPASLGRHEVVALCEDVRVRLVSGRAEVVVCDASGLGPPALTTVDALARLQLAARRAGGRIRLRDPAPALRALLDLSGLPIELEGQVEQREPALRVEEAVEPGDPAL
ncbi:STAS domain-containing protein [Streptomyces sp. NPDC008222]|uniref:STAS domain-containing protein n=1 Tax=Streptomyces sp. NPDC008222 TaxID=3364820 RepID=UPI0036E031FC